MMSAKSFGFLTAGLSLVLIVFGCDGAPRPCPQFLPVAVQLEPAPRYTLRTQVRVKNENENVISKSEKDDPYQTGFQLPKASESSLKATKNKVDDVKFEHKDTDISKLINDFAITTETTFSTTKNPSKQPSKLKQRRQNKGPTKLILSQNTNWSLKTINDHPALEVLMTDKASQARDLKDSTESALVKVHKLEEQDNST